MSARKSISTILVAFLMFNISPQAAEFSQKLNDNTTAQMLTSAVFSQMESEGVFFNLDDEAVIAAKGVVNTILGDKNLFNAYKNGDLVLDEKIIADYFFGPLGEAIEDIGKKVGEGIKDVATTVVGGIKTAAEKTLELAKKALPIVKEALKRTVHFANVAITTLKDNKTVNAILMDSILIADKIIEVGGPIAGEALIAVPYVGPVLGPAVATASKILPHVVTPENVQKALLVASVTTGIADALINPEKQPAAPAAAAAAQAPSMDIKTALQVSLKYKNQLSSVDFDRWPESQKRELADAIASQPALNYAAILKGTAAQGLFKINLIKAGRYYHDAVNRAVVLAAKGGRALMNYYLKLSPQEKAALPAKITNAIDKVRLLLSKVKTN